MGEQKIICGDSLEVMRGFKDKQFDLVLTDPPYGVDFHGEEWDKEIPNWFEEGQRISKRQIIITGNTTIWDYPRADWVGCWYRPASSSRSKLGGFSHWNPILFYGDFKFPVDTINLHAIQHSYPQGWEHPSPKPLELMRWLIESATEENDTVLDPFMGSATTLVSAKQLKINCTGIEISPKYCKIAQERLDATPNPLF